MIDPLELPFDQYQRYRLVSDLVEELRPRKERLTVLDVGGRTALLRAFLPEDRVVLVDLEPSGESGLVLGDGSRLPFRDASFDVVAAFDTLEHVPPPLRAKFVAECRRVARRWVILAGPYRSAEVEEAEKILQRFLADKLKVEHRYLEEHRHNGLPSRAETERALASTGAAVVSIGHGNLERWLALICMSMYMDYTAGLRSIARRFFSFYNKNLYDSDTSEPVYRHAVVAAIGGAALPRGPAAKEGGAAITTPTGALGRVTDLAFELVAFDRAHAAWDDTWRRMHEVHRDLAQDLEGHRATLEEARRIQREQSEVIQTLELDLDGHRAIKARLQGELQAVDRDREAVRRECEKVRGDFDRLLADHESVRAELETQLAEHKAVITALETDLSGHRLVVAELTKDLASHRDLAGVQLAEIQESTHRIEELTDRLERASAELDDRWRTFVRAVGPRRPLP